MILKKQFSIIYLIAIILIISLACNLPNPSTNQAEPEDPEQAVTEVNLQPSMEEIAPDPEPQASPEDSPPPQTLPKTAYDSSGKELVVVNSVFKNNDYFVPYAYEIKNTDPTYALTTTYCTVEAFDANGESVGEWEDYVEFLKPDETTKFSGQIWKLNENVAEEIKVACEYQLTDNAEYTLPFEITNEHIFYDDLFSQHLVTAIFKNTSPTTYLYTRIDAIAYNNAGEMIGGGYDVISFIYGNTQVGTSITLNIDEQPAKIEFFPKTPSYNEIDDNPARTSQISVVASNFESFDTYLAGGMLLKNNTDQLITGFNVLTTFYAADGSVCMKDYYGGDAIFPGETIGSSNGSIFFPEECIPNNYESYVYPLDVAEPQLPTNPFSVSNAQFSNEDYPKVTVTITNNYNQRISDVTVNVLLYNTDGVIIGGSKDYVGEIVANGSAEMEIWVSDIGNQSIGKIEVYPSLTSYTIIGD